MTTYEEQILQILLGMQADFTEMKTDITGMKADIAALQQGQEKMQGDIAKMQGDIAALQQGQEKMQGDIAALQQSHERLTQTVVNLETELVPRVTALFDGYSLRGDQIQRVQEHFDERMDTYYENVSFLFTKFASHEQQLLAISRQLKKIAQ